MRFFPRPVFVSQAELELQKKYFNKPTFFLIPHARRTSFAISKKILFNQFSLESKEYHGHSLSKMSSLFFVVIVSQLKIKPENVQIGSANRGNVVPVGTVSLGR